MKILNIIRQKNSFLKKRNNGQAMLVSVVYFLFISLSVIFGIISPSVNEYKISNTDLNSKKSYYLAESGMEDIINRAKMGIPISESPEKETLTIDGNSVETIIQTSSGLKEITSLGNVSNYNRTVFSSLNKGVGVAFNYGVLSGLGGFIMENESKINGNVFSNGGIIGNGNGNGQPIITDTAISANFSSLNVAASNTECPVGSCVDRFFGQTIPEEDALQSLKADASGLLSRIELRIKKVGSGDTHPDLIIRVVEGDGHGPSSPYVEIESARLTSKEINTGYQWVGVNFSETQELLPGKIYWIIIDSLSSDKFSYYSIQSNQSSYGPYGGAFENYDHNSWTSWFTAGEDLLFNIYTIKEGFIEQVTVGMDAKAYRVEGSKITGKLDCKIGNNNNGKVCFDPNNFTPSEEKPMPILDSTIEQWKSDSNPDDGFPHILGTQKFDDGKTHDIGPNKIEGDLTVSKKTILNIQGTVYVTGNVLIQDNGTTVRLGSNYTGEDDGVMVVDGTIVLANNVIFGEPSNERFLIGLSTSTSGEAIRISQNAGSAIIYAQNGGIELLQNASAIELVGRTIHLNNGAVVNYNTGVADSNFVSGPGGTWNIESWREQ